MRPELSYVARRNQCLAVRGTIPYERLGDLPALIVHELRRAGPPSQAALLAWGRERFPARHSRRFGAAIGLVILLVL